MMVKWKIVTLSDLGEIVGGATPATSREDYYNGDIPWLTPKDLAGYSGRYIRRGERNITKTGLESCSAKIMPKNTVLFSSRAPIGYIAIAENDICTNQGFKSIVPNANVSPLFLYYLLKYNKEKIEAMGSGTTFKEVSAATMRIVDVKIPISLNEQERIASILDSLDSKIELNQDINANLQQQAKAIYYDWFVNYSPFGGVVPKSWFTGTLADLASDIVCGKTPSTGRIDYYGGDIPFITIPDMHNQVYAVTTERNLSKLGAASQASKMLPRNSVCVSCIGTAGLVCLVSRPSQTNQQINSILPKKDVSPYYIYLLAQTLSNTIQSLGSGGSTICNLNKTKFAQIKALIPAMDAMYDFDTIVKPIFEVINSIQQENLKLAALRNTLLPKLMSGEIDVANI